MIISTLNKIWQLYYHFFLQIFYFCRLFYKIKCTWKLEFSKKYADFSADFSTKNLILNQICNFFFQLQFLQIDLQIRTHEDTLRKTSLMFTLKEPKTANISKAKESEEFLLSDHWHIIPTQRLLRNDAGHWWSQQANRNGLKYNQWEISPQWNNFFFLWNCSLKIINPNEKIFLRF